MQVSVFVSFRGASSCTKEPRLPMAEKRVSMAMRQNTVRDRLIIGDNSERC